MGMDIDTEDVDMDKPAKGGQKGKKEKKKGKAAKGKRAEEKKFVLIFQFFIYLFHNLILIFKTPVREERV